MQRYFFDLESDGFDARDEVGVVLANLGEARREALHALRSCLGSPLPSGVSPDLALKIRDETGCTILRLALPAATGATSLTAAA